MSGRIQNNYNGVYIVGNQTNNGAFDTMRTWQIAHLQLTIFSDSFLEGKETDACVATSRLVFWSKKCCLFHNKQQSTLTGFHNYVGGPHSTNLLSKNLDNIQVSVELYGESVGMPSSCIITYNIKFSIFQCSLKCINSNVFKFFRCRLNFV